MVTVITTVLFVVLPMAQSFLQIKQFYVRTFNCSSSYGVPAGSTRVRIFEQCGNICGLNDLCQSVLYDERNGFCVENKEVMPMESHIQSCGQVFKYAEKRNTTLTFLVQTDPAPTTADTASSGQQVEASGIEDECSSDTDCPVYNSACMTLICRCLPGFSFDDVNELCVTNCGAYGTAFQYYPDSILFGYDEHTLTDVSEYACALACVQNSNVTVCRSLDYTPATGTCHLSSETVASQPLQFKTLVGTHHRQRDCL